MLSFLMLVLQPLSASAQQARKIYTSSELLGRVFNSNDDI